MLSSFGTGGCVDHHIDLFFCSSITIFDYWIFLSFTGMSRISTVSGVSIHQSIPCLLHKDIKASYIEVLSPSQMFFVKFLSSSFLLPFHVSPSFVIIILVILVITSFVILVILVIFIIVVHYRDFHQDHKQDSAGFSASTKLS